MHYVAKSTARWPRTWETHQVVISADIMVWCQRNAKFFLYKPCVMCLTCFSLLCCTLALSLPPRWEWARASLLSAKKWVNLICILNNNKKILIHNSGVRCKLECEFSPNKKRWGSERQWSIDQSFTTCKMQFVLYNHTQPTIATPYLLKWYKIIFQCFIKTKISPELRKLLQ